MRYILVGATAVLLHAQPAMSAQTTANFNVTITITKQCTVTAPGTINLGTIGANDLITTMTSQAQSYTVTCSKGTGYTIGFSSPNDLSAGSATHQMKGTGGNTDSVQYTLFDGSGTIPLDASTHVVTDTGTGSSQTKSVKAQVVNYTTAVTPDVYTDTVTMTVTY